VCICERNENRDPNRYLHTQVPAALFTIAKGGSLSSAHQQCVDKINVVYTYGGVLFNLKKKSILIHATT
jgi:hypothetical protein